IKVSVPGNPDPDPSTPYINEDLLPPTGIPAVIDAASAVDLTLGIPRYENLHAGDVITLYWTGISVTHTVTAAEASTPTLPLSIVVSADIIRANPGLALVVNYDIRDVVKNWSLFSLSTHTDVEAPGGLLTPSVRDADDYDVLDVDDLNGGDVAIWVPVRDNLAVGEQGVLTWVGQPVLGSQVHYTQPFVIAQAATRLTLYVPNGQAAALVGSTASVYYDVNGRRSSRASVSLIGQPVTLALPHLTNVTPPDYNPDLIPGSTQEVIVPAYAFMAVGQRVTLVWDGTSASGGNVYETFERDIQSQSQVGRDISFQVDKNLAAALAGGSLKVSYKVAAGGQEYPSPELELNVVGQTSTLPVPQTYPEFADGQVDPNLVGDSVSVIIQARAPLSPGDIINLYWHGRADASYSHEFVFPASGNLDVTIDTSPFITGNALGDVEVWYTARSGSTDLGTSGSLVLHIGEVTEHPWPAPIVHDATGTAIAEFHPVRPGTVAEENGVTVLINDDRLLPGDTVAVVLVIPGREPDAEFATVSAGLASAALRRELIVASLGKQVMFEYVVWRNGEVIATWAELYLPFLDIPESALPIPYIVEATGGALDVTRLPSDATAKVDAWVWLMPGQHYWFQALGTLANGSSTVITLATNALVSGAVTEPVPLAELQALLDGSTLTLVMRVAFGTDSENTVTFAQHAYTVHTLVEARPTITAVTSATGPVVHNGYTSSTAVTLAGTGTPGQPLDIIDGVTVVGTTVVNAQGQWTAQVTGLIVGAHTFKARDAFGDRLESAVWAINVVALLQIDTTTMTLSGRVLRDTRIPTAPPANSSATRTATGGKPPYTYSSANVNIAQVNAQTGQVYSVGNGSTRITAQDAIGQTVSYAVTTSNVYRVIFTSGYQTYKYVESYTTQAGARLMSLAEFRSYLATYNGVPQNNGVFWTTDVAGVGLRWAIESQTGHTQKLVDLGFGGNTAFGMGIKNT
ncbi:hypothetical protein PMM47T1_22502, partial [Pseudomonas sp. M47T1]